MDFSILTRGGCPPGFGTFGPAGRFFFLIDVVAFESGVLDGFIGQIPNKTGFICPLCYMEIIAVIDGLEPFAFIIILDNPNQIQLGGIP